MEQVQEVQTEAVLPSAWTLFKEGWKFMTTRLDLVALYALPSFLLLLAEIVPASGVKILGAGSWLALAVVALIGFVGAIIIQMIILRVVVADRSAEDSTIAAGWQWAKQNVWGWLWMVLLTSLVVMGGMMLLIIPGIIAAVYLSMAYYVFADQDVRGMAVLQRSRALVVGRGWSVFGRLFVVGLLAMVTMIPLFIVSGMLYEVVAGLGGGVAGGVIEALATGVVTVLAMYAIAGLYVALRNRSVIAEPTKWYTGYACLGVVSIVLFVGAGAFFAGTMAMTGYNDALLEGSVDQSAEIDAFMQEFGEEVDSIE